LKSIGCSRRRFGDESAHYAIKDDSDRIAAPPQSAHVLTSSLNIRVADVWAIYREWKERGADFVTEPKDHGMEIRCYIRDPDGNLIEVGQSTGILDKDKAPGI
jgi:lactoylglutathione lyase